MNTALFNYIHAGAGSRPMLDFLGIAAAEWSPWLAIIVMAGLWFTSVDSERRDLIEAAAAVALGLMLNHIITLFYFHPRPFMIGLCRPLISHAAESSFPSDHATLLFAVALSLSGRKRRRIPGAGLFGLALIGSWGRVYTGVHFPIDILGSFTVAALSAGIMAATRRLLTPAWDRIITITNRIVKKSGATTPGNVPKEQ